MTHKLTHIDAANHPAMVNVTDKAITRREATAQAQVRYPRPVWDVLFAQDFRTKKGAVLDVARIAGVMAAKRTSDLIPFCHPIAIEGCTIQIEPVAEQCSIIIRCTATTEGKTGVEMEALAGASGAALTLYDMTKSLSHEIMIECVRLLSKSGGKSNFQSQ